MAYGHRYTIIQHLEEMKPTVIILYNTDIVALRHIEALMIPRRYETDRDVVHRLQMPMASDGQHALHADERPKVHS
ncbi:hypothetical protein DICVIV_03419 [Dictyocaulus viviparus]|uniref:Uncharacterized protein n=1 Tax=Dictyocaulus viviparus TaxID=29172 RepID=A0A0D8Y0L6_DICVI|nr:hypothetical protein DICVIV_03419 [Dictyocaulus viviparus]